MFGTSRTGRPNRDHAVVVENAAFPAVPVGVPPVVLQHTQRSLNGDSPTDPDPDVPGGPPATAREPRALPLLTASLQLAALLICFAALPLTLSAHEIRPGYLDLQEQTDGRLAVTWKVPTLAAALGSQMPALPTATGQRGASVPRVGEREPCGCPSLWARPRSSLVVPIHPVFPADFEPVAPPEVQEVGDFQLWTWTFERPVEGLNGVEIGVHGLDATTMDVLIRVAFADGRVATRLLTPVASTLTLTASDRPQLGGYLRLGIAHILLGVDHLLFVLGLLLIVPDRWMLLKTVTAFTVAHSLTLAVATFGYAQAPLEPLNVAIALSILFLGPEVVRFRRGETSLTIRHPWAVAFAFGLLHGFGFASGLSSLGLPPGEIPLALLLFNVGVEIGQVGFVALVLGLVASFRVLEVRWPRPVLALPGVAVGSLGAFWFVQRLVVMVSAWR
jgi:hypothetical protein